MYMAISPQNYIKLTDVDIRQKYNSNKNIPERLTIPIHKCSKIVPDNPDVAIMKAIITFDSENIFITLPHAESRNWIHDVLTNLRYYLKRVYNIHMKENNFDMKYTYGFPHPCLDINVIEDIISIEPVEPHIDGVYDKILKYELSGGFMYMNMDNGSIKLAPLNDSTEDNLISSLNEQIRNDIDNRLIHLDMEVFNPHGRIFKKSILKPFFINNKEKKIEFWNTVANDIFTRDLINKPTPRLRLLCEHMGCEGSEASMIWLELIATLDYEMPLIGNTLQYIEDIGNMTNTSQIAWKNGIEKYEKLYPQLLDISQYELGYSEDIIPNSDIIKIHANDKNQILAAEPLVYGPIVPLSDRDIQNLDKYFWSENGWRMIIKGARPCDVLGEDFDSKEIKTYWEDKNRYMLADKSSIESAAPLTEDEMLNFMTILKDK